MRTKEWQQEGIDPITVRLRSDLVLGGSIVSALYRLVQIAQLFDVVKSESDEPTIIHALIGNVMVQVNGRSHAAKACFAYLRARQMPYETVVGLDLQIKPKH